jgi:hypothetical protein
MKHLALFLSTVTAVAGLQHTASAQLINPDRCPNAFGVTQAQAQGRYAWALYCRNHPRTDATNVTLVPGNHYLTDASLDYYNTDTDAFQKVHLFPTYHDFVTNGIWDIPDTAYWTEVIGGGGCLTTAPGSTVSSNLLPVQCPIAPGPQTSALATTSVQGNDCYALPTSALNVGLCVAGCYTEDTALQFAGGAMGIKAAALAGKVDLITLDPSATLDRLQYTENKVAHYITDMREDWQTIYTLTMKSGGRLNVTSEHPLLTDDGIIRQAQHLAIGSRLVRADGKPDPVVQIDVKKIFGKVYNVKPVTLDYVSNIVVAEGYLNGSVRYQNEFLTAVNSLILRRSLASQADQLVGR